MASPTQPTNSAIASRKKLNAGRAEFVRCVERHVNEPSLYRPSDGGPPPPPPDVPPRLPRGCARLEGRYLLRLCDTPAGWRVCHEGWSVQSGICASCPTATVGRLRPPGRSRVEGDAPG